MTFEEWLAEGRKHGWVGAGYCATHDGLALTAEEARMFNDEGIDVCTPSLRVYPDGDAPSEDQ